MISYKLFFEIFKQESPLKYVSLDTDFGKLRYKYDTHHLGRSENHFKACSGKKESKSTSIEKS